MLELKLPKSDEEEADFWDRVDITQILEEAVKDSDCIVLITDHPEFKDVEPEGISKIMRNTNVVDTRNLLDTERWKEAGFNVHEIGVGLMCVRLRIAHQK
ncbi:UDP-N-acetyl-D-mannosaminuronate dehydrogenase [Candidatus Methanophagaceae archaeon]|nr:UDP-N-acetyl-D-mannosaminuronate dehydrogenase [Methanophagales archaeon]